MQSTLYTINHWPPKRESFGGHFVVEASWVFNLQIQSIVALQEDATGWLWLVETKTKEICLFHPVSGETWSLEEHLGKEVSGVVGNDFINKIIRDDQGILWFGLLNTKTC